MRSSRASGGRRGVTGLILFLAVWGAYRESPVVQVSDAYYTVLSSQALLDGNGLVLDSYLRSRPGQPVIGPAGTRVQAGTLPYQLEDFAGHLRCRYPVGSAVLSAPLLAAMRPFGYAPVDSAGQYDPAAESGIIHHLAAFVGALFVLLVYLASAELLPLRWATAVALLAAFASPAWSSLSRSLWSQSWMAVLVAAAVWHLLRRVNESHAPSGVLLATLLSWAFFCRPTAALPIVAVGLYLWLRHRRQVLLYCVTGLVWAAPFVVWSWFGYGRIMHPYYFLLTEARLVDDTPFLAALAGTLISPSRGLLVFCSWIPVLVWILWRYRSELRPRGLVYVAGALCVLHLLLVAVSPRWWGGWSYGPRLQADMLPWLMLIVAVSIDAWRRGDRRSIPMRRRTVEATALIATVFLSSALHAPGALSQQAFAWNKGPRANQETAVWDWSDPQFLAWRQGHADLDPGESRSPAESVK